MKRWAYKTLLWFFSGIFLFSAGMLIWYYLDSRVQEESYDQLSAIVSQCKEISLYDTGITPQYGEKLITLSTCEKSLTNGRLVVVARLIEEQ